MPFDSNRADLFVECAVDLISQLTSMSLELKSQNQYLRIQTRLSNLANELFNNTMDVWTFGSRPIGVATAASDLDLCIVFKGSHHNRFVENADHDDRFNKILDALKREYDAFEFVSSNIGDRIPTMKFNYLPMKLDLDINISTLMGYYNSRMLQHLFELQPEAVSLFHFFREFTRDQQFEGLQSYTLMLLVVHYLQGKGFLPTINQVQSGIPPTLVNEWPVQINMHRTLEGYSITKKLAYEEHMVSLFKYYQDHDYTKVISVHDGCLADGAEYQKKYPEFELKGLLVAGPVNLKRNCGVVGDDVRNEFIQLIGASASHLENKVCFKR